MRWLRSSDRLVRLLPGVYARPEIAVLDWARIRTVNLWDPAAVVTGRAAAHWSFWDGLHFDKVEVAVRSDRVPQVGYLLSQRRVPGHLTQTTLRVTHTVPALTAIDLVPDLGGDAIDTVLRKGVADLPSMHEALSETCRRRGNRARARLLLDSRDLPWSAAERLLHEILRASHLRGWSTNQPIYVEGRRYLVDLLFRTAKVIIEVDGWEWHGKRASDFQSTMHRHTALESAGWRVLHLTFHDLQADPAWVIQVIERTLAL